MEQQEQKITEILERNKRVELDKAWETSWTRRISITVLTYFIACIVLKLIDVEQYALNALVPTAGYVLSTLSLPWIKKQWMKRQSKR